jgi:hypothetical protein
MIINYLKLNNLKMNKFIKYFCCCYINDEKSNNKVYVNDADKEIENAINNELELEKKMKERELIEIKRRRQIGLKSYISEEANVNMSKKLANNKSIKRKIINSVKNGVDDFNSLAFNM